MIRTLIIFTWTIISTAVIGSTCVLVSFFSKTGNAVHLLARIWARSILWASRIPVDVVGRENIQDGQHYIYMSNHQSNFDIPVLLAHLTVQFRWLAKAELFRIPIFGQGMRGAGYISIDRTNRKSAFQSLNKAAQKIREGVSVVLFPEGTRSIDGQIRSFKKGGFVLAVDAGVPIVPIIIKGTWPIMPKSRLRIRPGKVTLYIGAPIRTNEYTRKTKDQLLEKIHQTLHAMAADLNGSTAQ